MNQNNTLLLILLLLTPIVFGQTTAEKLIHGQIVADATFVAGIEVVNLSNEKTAITNGNGEFFILAKVDDVLVFSAPHLDFNRKIIEEDDLKLDIIIIKMTPKSIELEEVIVNKHPEINALSLGIIQKEPKHLSPAERGRYSQPKGILDAIKIKITGKNPALEQAIATGKKIELLHKIEYLFQDKYYTETLKIPFDYIKGFQYYCIENSNFATALKSKNKSMAMFLIVDLAKNYTQMIACEQK